LTKGPEETPAVSAAWDSAAAYRVGAVIMVEDVVTRERERETRSEVVGLKVANYRSHEVISGL
jgi:hypothetical protein